MASIKILFGTAGIELWNKDGLDDILKLLKSYGVNDLDAAYLYGNEEHLGAANVAKSFTIHTKAPGFSPGSNSRTSVLEGNKVSLEKLNTDQVETYFLHAPDTTVPIEETLGAIQELYEAKKFKHFGLSNFSVEGVQEVYDLATAKGWVLPTVYQGNYNPISRHSEKDLFPLLRKLGIRFYVYSPLAGGFLAKSAQGIKDGLSGRWDPNTSIGGLYNRLYNRPSLLEALSKWTDIAEKANTTRAGLAYRWVLHHSAISADNQDGIIIGASSLEQAKQTLESLKAGPLPEEVLPLIEELWQAVKDEAPLDNYHG